MEPRRRSGARLEISGPTAGFLDTPTVEGYKHKKSKRDRDLVTRFHYDRKSANMEQYRPVIIKSVTWACFLASIYLLFQIIAADVAATPQPFWELFDQGQDGNGRIAVAYMLVGIFGTLIALVVGVVAVKFAYNMVHGSLVSIIPVDWRAIIFPVVLLGAFLLGHTWRDPIKYTALSAYVQIDEIFDVANGFDPALRND